MRTAKIRYNGLTVTHGARLLWSHNMRLLEDLSMSELIAYHNELADKLGISPEFSFKSLSAAYAATSILETRMDQTMYEQDQTTQSAEPEVPTSAPAANEPNNTKYNSIEKRGPRQGIGAFAKEQIIAGRTNAEILEMIQTQFPTAKTTVGCVAFYRTALKKATTVAETPAEANPA